MLRHDNTVESAHNISYRTILFLLCKIQRELVDEKKDIGQTAAAQEVESQIQELIQKHQASVKQLQEGLKEALRMKDKEAKRQLEEAKRDLKNKINDMKDDVKNMGLSTRSGQALPGDAHAEEHEEAERCLAAEQRAWASA